MSNVLPFGKPQRAKLPDNRTIAYVRSSSESQDMQFASIPQQVAAIKERYDVSDDWFFEDNFSGKTFNRPGWRRLVSYCKANPQNPEQPGLIACYDQSRFSRAPVKQVDYVRLQLEIEYGWKIVYVLGASSGNEFVDGIVSQVQAQKNNDYLIDLQIKVTSGKATARSLGYWTGGPPPFGASRYSLNTKRVLLEPRIDPDTGKRLPGEWGQKHSVVLVEDPEMRPLLEEAMRLIAEQKMTVSQACFRINEKGARTVYGLPLIPQVLHKCLLNRNLLGHADPLSDPECPRKWGPLVDVTLWHHCHAELTQRRAERRPMHIRGGYLLRTLYCASCGGHYTGYTSERVTGGKSVPKQTREIRTYRHAALTKRALGEDGYALAKQAGCKNYTTHADTIERAIRDVILEQRMGPAYASVMREIFNGLVTDEEGITRRVREAEDVVTDLKRRKSIIFEEIEEVDDKELRAKLRARYAELTSKIEVAQGEVMKIRHEAEVADGRWEAVERLMDETKDVLEAWDTATVDQKRRILDWWVVNVDIGIPSDGPRYGAARLLQVYLRPAPEAPEVSFLFEPRSARRRPSAKVYQFPTRSPEETGLNLLDEQDFKRLLANEVPEIFEVTIYEPARYDRRKLIAGNPEHDEKWADRARRRKKSQKAWRKKNPGYIKDWKARRRLLGRKDPDVREPAP